MARNSHRLARVTACAIIGLFSSATTARAQGASAPPSENTKQSATAEAAAQSAAVKASPELVNGLAKELGSTPEQAAGVAGVFFSLAKSLVKPEDFSAMSKAVPGMDALLAATPAGVVDPSAGSGLSTSMLTPGFASSTSLSTSPPKISAADGTASAVAGLSKLGIKPDMFLKALPFLSGYLKKFGGAALGPLFEGLFKGAPGK